MRLILSFLFLLHLSANGQSVYWLKRGTAPVRITMVMMPDGITEGNEIRGSEMCRRAQESYFEQPVMKRVLSDGLTAGEHFDVAMVLYYSVQDGVSWWNGPTRNTRYKLTHGWQGQDSRLVGTWYSLVAYKDAATALGFTTNVYVSLVADSRTYGGSGGSVIIVTDHTDSPKILNHEAGHTKWNLADEYCTPYPGWIFQEAPNSSKNLTNLPWKNIWAGYVVGGQYDCVNVYSPTPNCLMRTLDSQLCLVCEAHIIASLEARCVVKPTKRQLGEIYFTLSQT